MFSNNYVKSKFTKILNSEKNSKQKVSYQMSTSKAQKRQTNGQQLLYSSLGTEVLI